MVGTLEFLNYLREQGIQLYADGERLRYRAPTGVLTPALREQLGQRKDELLRLLAQANEPFPSIPTDPNTLTAPLSSGQRRLWLLEQLGSGRAYHVPLLLHLRGQFDPQVLQQSTPVLLARHACLRTSFQIHADEPIQQVHPHVTLVVPLTDLRGVCDQQAEMQRIVQPLIEQPFDLSQPPLTRGEIIQLADDHTVIAITHHHIIVDGLSVDLILQELAQCYTAFVQQQTPDLPPVPIQYTDYARWQQQRNRPEDYPDDLRYWTQQLADLPPLLPLPLDYPRPPVASIRGTQHTQVIPQPLLDQLRGLSQQAGTTLSMTMLATYALLLMRSTGQATIPIGMPISHRPQPELEHLVGFFLNTLVLRVQMNPPTMTGRELLGHVREVALAAYAHQDLPFELLVEALQPERSASYTPLFQAMFEFENAPVRQLELPNLTLSREWLPHGGAQTDLALLIEETPHELICQWEYATDLFAPATITRFAESYTTLLHALVAQPDLPIRQLPILTDAQQHTIIHAWNNTARAYPTDLGVHHLIERQVQRTPHAIAVQMGDTRLTYAELNQQADALAAQLTAALQQLGTPALDTPLALCLTRSPMLIVALLAMLKTGAAYLPLDPEHPTERLRLILADAQPALVLTERTLHARFADLDLPLILRDDLPTPPPAAATPHRPAFNPDQLAYLIYTSGSSGTPKGVAVPHRSVVNFLYAMQHEPGIAATDRLLAVTTVAFDIAVLELLLPLTAGAQVILASSEQSRDGLQLVQLLEQSGATMMQATPATWRMLLASGWQGDQTLKLLCGGEALAPDLVAQLLQRGRAVWNLYGPTETTIWSTINRITDATPPILIGRPIANTSCYILDAEGVPVPPGVIGELYIGGGGVVRGYHRRPELTAERFVPDPFAASAGARMYRTGDQARFHSDGRIEYLGRADFQIKLRGVRIEPGEVEAAILRHPQIREAAVVLALPPAEPALIAYIVPQVDIDVPATDALLGELRQQLSTALPPAMLPAHYVLLPQLPLNPNGKLDRSRLPAPVAAPASANVSAPRTPLEQLLTTVWQDVLAQPTISIHDNFFLLGGHSLRATQVVARLRDHLNYNVPVRWLFEHPTIAALAAALAAAPDAPTVPVGDEPVGAAPLPAADTIPRRRPTELPHLSLSQQRLWVLEQLGELAPTYTLTLSFRLRGPLDPDRLERATAFLVQRHSSLRTTFVLAEPLASDGRAAPSPEPLQQVAAARGFRLAHTDLSTLPPDQRTAELERRCTVQARTPLRMQDAELFQANLYRLDRHEWVLLWRCHHSITDGWSLDLLIRELGEVYTAFGQGQSPSLPEPPLEYADYAVWQRTQRDTPHTRQQQAYWVEQLGGLPALLDLPTDRPRPAIQPTHGARLLWRIPPDLLLALRGLAQHHAATLYMTVLAAFATLLMRYTQHTDLAIGTPVAGRSHTALEPLVGFFVNMLVMRVQPTPQQSFAELLGPVRQTTLAALAHADLPFSQLVEAIQPARNLSYQPLFQVAFALEQAPQRTLHLPQIESETTWLHSGAVQYDLALLLEEHDGQVYGEWAYATALFDTATIERMATNFEVLLRAVVAAPEQPLGTLPLLSAAEREQLLVTWNAPTSAYDRHTPAHALIAARAAAQPHALAVWDPQHRLSYAALNARADTLAATLLAHGLEPEQPVVLYLERGVTFVVAMLAVLKAGGAFLPLDPSTPPARVQRIVADARPCCVLTSPTLRATLANVGVPCLIPATLADAHPHQPPLDVPTTPEQLAYIIYTSGSTGAPKGVQLTHGGLSNLIAWYCRYYAVTAQDRLTQLVSLSFDALVWELLPALSAGASVFMPDETTRTTPHMLRDWLIANAITITFLPTPLAEQLLLLDWSGASALRVMQTAGDRLRRYPPVGLPFTLYNNYGPAETTIATTATPVPPNPAALSAPPIGKPIANTRLYVLDAMQQPVPIGVVGELYVAGDSLARGYLGQPELTATRFVPNPFDPTPASRMYRTGDLVRYRADGQLEFVGRVDEQVKVRGVRIEPGEITALLQQHPEVQHALVVPLNDTHGEAYLTAYIVPRTPLLAVAALRDYLQTLLPTTMIPTAWVLLEALPLTPNGKIDRQALPLPVRETTTNGYAAPTTPYEQQLAPIWAEVLGIPLAAVNIHTDFFAAGGHSLRAMQLVSRLTSTSGVRVSMRDLFAAPTLAELAAQLATRAAASPPAAPTPAPAELLHRTPEASPPVLPSASGLQIESRPLLSLYAAGELAPVDAAALYYLPADLLTDAARPANELLRLWTDDLPLFDDVVSTPAGRIASILLPRTSDDLYRDRAGLVRQIMQGVQLARQIGAGVVSLTGLLPSATNYGQDVQAALVAAADPTLPQITTGHATTTAAVVLNVQRILEESGRNLAHERVGVLGLGSIGQAVTRLLLDLLPHPPALLLCDVYAKAPELAEFARSLHTQHNYRGTIEVLTVADAVPDTFYTARLIIGATNVPDVLDVWQLLPGTLLVDDSGPACYNQAHAIARFQAQHDILVTEGGALQPPHAVQSVRYIPPALRGLLAPAAVVQLAAHATDSVMGCTLSAALSREHPTLVPTIGLLHADTARQHAHLLQQLGYRGGPLHAGAWRATTTDLAAFRQQTELVT
ncbi:MAG: amino acid adenylation domain-containing protein [Chloroflexaceae bacterium]|nr:amino acid adenylation domain-containing protein [Chloroflexaceae bacterium]